MGLLSKNKAITIENDVHYVSKYQQKADLFIKTKKIKLPVASKNIYVHSMVNLFIDKQDFMLASY